VLYDAGVFRRIAHDLLDVMLELASLTTGHFGKAAGFGIYVLLRKIAGLGP